MYQTNKIFNHLQTLAQAQAQAQALIQILILTQTQTLILILILIQIIKAWEYQSQTMLAKQFGSS
jgi:hypothetical protein